MIHPATHRGVTSPPTSSFGDELNKLLQDDQQHLAGAARQQTTHMQNGKKPITGRRHLTTNTSAAPHTLTHHHATGNISSVKSSSSPTAASLAANTPRGPRPRTNHSGGPYTSRAAKDATIAAAAAAAAAAPPVAAREVSSDSDDSDDDGPGVNQVSSNAAAALYAQPLASPMNVPAATPSATAASTSSPTQSQPGLLRFGSMTAASQNGQPAPANSSVNVGASSSSSAALPEETYSSSIVGGGGIVGERDPTLKWAHVDAFALATPKQKTGSVLVLGNYLSKSPATPNPIDKVRAIFRWIAEFITWIPTPVPDGPNASLALSRSVSTPVQRTRGVSEASFQAKEAAKLAAESKMEQDLRSSRIHHSPLDDDDDDDDIGRGSAGRGPTIDVLTDVGEILRRRRASAEGLANLTQELIESAGLDCIKIHGYGKGCGLIRVAERFDHPNHWWVGVKLDAGGWILIDPAWSSAYINNGKLEKTFTNVYFRTNPTIFALQHHPVEVILGRRSNKTLTDLVKSPEKAQFLDATAPTPAHATTTTTNKPKAITKTQFEDAMMIERGYLDLGILAQHPLGVHTVRHDTPLYTITLQAPITLEFIVGMPLPTKSKVDPSAAQQQTRFVDQCWNVSYTPLQDDPTMQRVEIAFVFPWKSTYTLTVRARRLASKLLQYEDVIHYRFLISCGLYDIRKEKDVYCGFLARRIVVGADYEFEHKFSVLRPLKGHFELGQPARLQLAAPPSVTRMVAVNNGRWIELIGSPSGQAQGPLKNKTIFEGDLKLVRFPDIQIHYKLKGQQFNLLYKYGVTEGAGSDGGSGNVKQLSASGSSTCDVELEENKHGKIVLDSRGTVFEKRLRINQLRIGKRSCAISFETKAGTQVKAEVRAGWASAQKVNDKITVSQTGSRQAAPEEKKCQCAAQPCTHQGTTATAPQYDVVTWECVTQLAEPGDYSVRTDTRAHNSKATQSMHHTHFIVSCVSLSLSFSFFSPADSSFPLLGWQRRVSLRARAAPTHG